MPLEDAVQAQREPEKVGQHTFRKLDAQLLERVGEAPDLSTVPCCVCTRQPAWPARQSTRQPSSRQPCPGQGGRGSRASQAVLPEQGTKFRLPFTSSWPHYPPCKTKAVPTSGRPVHGWFHPAATHRWAQLQRSPIPANCECGEICGEACAASKKGVGCRQAGAARQDGAVWATQSTKALAMQVAKDVAHGTQDN